MKLTALGSGDYGEDPRLTCHNVSFSSLATVRFIGSKSILVYDDALQDLSMMSVHLFFGAAMGRRRMMFRCCTCFSKGKIILLLVGVFFCLTYKFKYIHITYFRTEIVLATEDVSLFGNDFSSFHVRNCRHGERSECRDSLYSQAHGRDADALPPGVRRQPLVWLALNSTGNASPESCRSSSLNPHPPAAAFFNSADSSASSPHAPHESASHSFPAPDSPNPRPARPPSLNYCGRIRRNPSLSPPPSR
jgi:hypothetical protein